MFMIGNAMIVIVRALIPVIGVVFLHWSAPKLLVVYLADTAAAYYVLLASMAIASGGDAAPHSSPKLERLDARLPKLIRAALVPMPTLALIGLFFGILPLFVMLDLQGVSWPDFLRDGDLWRGVALQFALAASLIVRRSYAEEPAAEGGLGIAVQGRCLTLRWLAMILIGFFLAPDIPRMVYGPLLIAVYSLATMALELAPYRVLDWATRLTGPPQLPGKGGKRTS